MPCCASPSISARVCASERAEAAGTYVTHVTHLKLSAVILPAFWLQMPLKPSGSLEQISLFVFVGLFESFNVGDYFFP